MVLAWSRKLLDEKVGSQGVFFCVFWKLSGGDIWEGTSSSLPLPELLGFPLVPGKRQLPSISPNLYGLALVASSLLLQHAMTIQDSRLCRLRFDDVIE